MHIYSPRTSVTFQHTTIAAYNNMRKRPDMKAMDQGEIQKEQDIAVWNRCLLGHQTQDKVLISSPGVGQVKVDCQKSQSSWAMTSLEGDFKLERCLRCRRDPLQ